MADVKGPQARYDELMEAATRQGGAENSLGALLGLLGVVKAPALTAAGWLDSQMPRRQIGGKDVLEGVVPRSVKLQRKITEAGNIKPAVTNKDPHYIERYQYETGVAPASRRPGNFVLSRRKETPGLDTYSKPGGPHYEGGANRVGGKAEVNPALALGGIPRDPRTTGKILYDSFFQSTPGIPDIRKVAKENRWAGLSRNDFRQLEKLPPDLLKEALGFKAARNRGYASVVDHFGRKRPEWIQERILMPKYRQEPEKFVADWETILNEVKR